MDRIIPFHQRNKYNFFRYVHPLDWVPYSLAFLMLCGSVYLVLLFIKVTQQLH